MWAKSKKERNRKVENNGLIRLVGSSVFGMREIEVPLTEGIAVSLMKVYLVDADLSSKINEFLYHFGSGRGYYNVVAVVTLMVLDKRTSRIAGKSLLAEPQGKPTNSQSWI